MSNTNEQIKYWYIPNFHIFLLVLIPISRYITQETNFYINWLNLPRRTILVTGTEFIGVHDFSRLTTVRHIKQLMVLPHQQLDVDEALGMMTENSSGSGSQQQIGSSVLYSVKWGKYIK